MFYFFLIKKENICNIYSDHSFPYSISFQIFPPLHLSNYIPFFIQKRIILNVLWNIFWRYSLINSQFPPWSTLLHSLNNFVSFYNYIRKIYFRALLYDSVLMFINYSIYLKFVKIAFFKYSNQNKKNRVKGAHWDRLYKKFRLLFHE